MVEQAEDGAARDSASASAACGTTTRWRGSSSDADEIARALDRGLRDEIVRALRAIGYRQVTSISRGIELGSLNEGIRLRPV